MLENNKIQLYPLTSILMFPETNVGAADLQAHQEHWTIKKLFSLVDKCKVVFVSDVVPGLPESEPHEALTKKTQSPGSHLRSID